MEENTWFFLKKFQVYLVDSVIGLLSFVETIPTPGIRDW